MFEPMIGTWITSFSSFVHDLPEDKNPKPTDHPVGDRPPQVGAYYLDRGTYTQTNGYYLASTILCLKFLPAGKLSGLVKINRGGRKLIEQDPISGKYQRIWNPTLGVHQGNFSTIYPGPSGGIKLDYLFVMKDINEIEWIWWTSTFKGKPFRASVARGTLQRALLGGQ